MRFIVFPGQINDNRADLATLGIKAGYLADLIMAGVPGILIPPCFVVRAAAFDASLDPAMARQLMSEEPDWDAFEQLRPDDSVLQEMADAWRILGAPPVLAVRASPPSGASDFTAAFDSFCPVMPAALPDRVADVWRSAFAEEAIDWHHRQARQGVQIPAIMVQARIAAQICGGVLTADPRNGGRNDIIVSAVRGGTDLWHSLQEGYYPADKTPPTAFYRVDRTSLQVTNVPEQPILNPGTLQSICHMATRIEQHFAVPVDLDWGIDAAGQLFLLQIRLLRNLPVPSEMDPQTSYAQNLSDDFPACWAGISGFYAARLNAGIAALGWSGDIVFHNIEGRLCADRMVLPGLITWLGLDPLASGIQPVPKGNQSDQGPVPRLTIWRKLILRHRLLRRIDYWQQRIEPVLARIDHMINEVDTGCEANRELLEVLEQVQNDCAEMPWILLLYPQHPAIRRIARLEHRLLAAWARIMTGQAESSRIAVPRGAFRQNGRVLTAENWWPSDRQARTFMTGMIGPIAAAP